MKKKIILIIALISVLFVSLTVGSLSSYSMDSSFGISVYPNLDKPKK